MKRLIITLILLLGIACLFKVMEARANVLSPCITYLDRDMQVCHMCRGIDGVYTFFTPRAWEEAVADGIVESNSRNERRMVLAKLEEQLRAIQYVRRSA